MSTAYHQSLRSHDDECEGSGESGSEGEDNEGEEPKPRHHTHPSDNNVYDRSNASLLSELGLLDIPSSTHLSNNRVSDSSGSALTSDANLMDLAVPLNVDQGGLLDMNIPPAEGEMDDREKQRYNSCPKTWGVLFARVHTASSSSHKFGRSFLSVLLGCCFSREVAWLY